MKKYLIIIFLFLFFSNLQAYQHSNEYGTYTLNNGIGSFKSKNFNFTITRAKGYWTIKMNGKTKGWIALGFDRTKQMRDSEIIIGYVKNDKPVLKHEYSIGYFIHKAIKDLDNNSIPIVSLLSGKETENYTSLVFKRKILVTGKYYKDLKPGKTVKILYAIGKDDDIKKRHIDRGLIDIILP